MNGSGPAHAEALHGHTRGVSCVALKERLILAVRPDLEKFVELVTHPSPTRVAQIHDRLVLYWPGMCEAVLAIRMGKATPGTGKHPERVARKVAGVTWPRSRVTADRV